MSHKKRGADDFGSSSKRRSNFASEEKAKGGDEHENLVFEDPFGDDMEDEEMVESDDDDDDEEIIDGERDGDDEDMEGDEEEQKQVKRVFMPGVDKLADDEVLDYDSSAYDMYYAMTAEWPSLSFDIVRDNLGAVRTRVRLSCDCICDGDISVHCIDVCINVH